jgi:hypothetical protein
LREPFSGRAETGPPSENASVSKVKGREAAHFHAAASLQGCGGCERAGLLAPKPANDKEIRGFFAGFAVAMDL